MKRRITEISVLQTSKVAAVLYAGFGIAIGFLMLLAALASEGHDNAVAAAILMPILYSVVAFIGTVLFAAFYNFIAKRFGGFEFTIGAEPFPPSPRFFSFEAQQAPNIDEELRKLAKLKEDGLITEDEFAQKKRTLLGI